MSTVILNMYAGHLHIDANHLSREKNEGLSGWSTLRTFDSLAISRKACAQLCLGRFNPKRGFVGLDAVQISGQSSVGGVFW